MPPPAWDRLLRGSYGRDTGWLLPAALLIIITVLAVRRRQPRTDKLRAGIVLWSMWLAALTVAFSISTAMNSYYTAALAPAVAALVGIAAALVWKRRREPVVLCFTVALVLITTAFAAWLLPSAGTGLPDWLEPAIIIVGLLAAGLLGASAWRALDPSETRRTSELGLFVAVLAVLAVLAAPAVAASASVVAEGLGPFDTPFQPTAVTKFVHGAFAPQPSPPGLALLESARHGAPFLMAAQTSALASAFVYATGQEVLPLGGYTGNDAGTIAALARVDGVTRAVPCRAHDRSQPPTAASGWVASHCLPCPESRRPVDTASHRTGPRQLLPTTLGQRAPAPTPDDRGMIRA